MMVCRGSLLPDLAKIVPKKTLAGNGLLVEGMTIQQSISSVTKQLRMQRSVVVPTGNTRVAHNTKRQFSWFNVDETPLQKRATGFQLQ